MKRVRCCRGARLTAYELQKVGVDVTLICDNMASAVMRKGWVQAVVVGCDRVRRANGDTANKIGLREWRSWLVITVFLFMC